MYETDLACIEAYDKYGSCLIVIVMGGVSLARGHA